MNRNFLTRLISLFISLFFVVTFTFFLMKLIPGDPFLKDQNIPQEVLDFLYKQSDFEKPLFSQYLIYLKKIMFLDFGKSLIFEDRSVIGIIKEGFPVSFFLGLKSLILSLSLGILGGTFSALKRKKWQDLTLMIIFSLGISIPSFLLGTFLQYFFSMQLPFFPVAKWGTISHSILPMLSLSLLPSAYIARLTRDSMIEVLEHDYVKLAKVKGISNFKFITSHLLKNSLFPLMGYIAPLTTNLIMGSFVVERIFGIPGLGDWLVTSILSRDYPVIMGLCIFYSFFLMVTIYLADVLYSCINPRIQIEKNI